MAAPFEIRLYIFSRDKFKCRDCKVQITEDTGIAGHLNHRIQRGIHRPSNIKTRCRPCEIAWHAKHWEQPESIGLNRHQNTDAILLQWERLSENEQIDFKKNRFSLFSLFKHLL